MSFNGIPIDAWGNAVVLGRRVFMSALQDLHYIGDEINLVVQRNREILELKQPLLPARYLVARGLYEQPAPYFVVGGPLFNSITNL